MGRWAKRGRPGAGAPAAPAEPSVVHPREIRASHSRMPFGVVGSRSSPRMTWVIAMSMSSTTLASTNSGAPLAFTATKDDFVAVKANGAPLFVLANVVDDIDMAITHVIRGEDLLPTTPKGILLWEALISLGWTTDGSAGAAGAPAPGLPLFAHLPMLVNEQRKKLSKRRDPVAVESYRDQGYLPEAFVNYLALLGWSPPGGEELFDTDQMIEWFRLEDVNHSPAFFDVAKLTHMNGEYVRAMSTEAFIEACGPWLTGDGPPWPETDFDPGVFARVAPLVQERVALLGEVPDMVDL